MKILLFILLTMSPPTASFAVSDEIEKNETDRKPASEASCTWAGMAEPNALGQPGYRCSSNKHWHPDFQTCKSACL